MIILSSFFVSLTQTRNRSGRMLTLRIYFYDAGVDCPIIFPQQLKFILAHKTKDPSLSDQVVAIYLLLEFHQIKFHQSDGHRACRYLKDFCQGIKVFSAVIFRLCNHGRESAFTLTSDLEFIQIFTS